jgi:hypothetical protein
VARPIVWWAVGPWVCLARVFYEFKQVFPGCLGDPHGCPRQFVAVPDVEARISLFLFVAAVPNVDAGISLFLSMVVVPDVNIQYFHSQDFPHCF